MNEKIPPIVKKAYNELPHFDDGRIDYTKARRAPVVAVFLKKRNKILILKRSDKVGTHRNRWSIIVGYLDELKSVIEKGLEEVNEETGIDREVISSVKRKGIYKFRSKKEQITYISHLVLAELEKEPEIDLNWEHTDHKWVKVENAKDYLSVHATEELKRVL